MNNQISSIQSSQSRWTPEGVKREGRGVRAGIQKVPFILYFATLQIFQALLYNASICELYFDSICVAGKADRVHSNLKLSKRYCEFSVYSIFPFAVVFAV